MLTKLSGDLFRVEAEGLYKKYGHIYINRNQTGAAMWLPAGVCSNPSLHWRWFAVIY